LAATEVSFAVAALWTKADDVWKVDERRTDNRLLCRVRGSWRRSAPKLSGIASFYGTNYSGRTARGERYDPNKFTAAHRTMPFGTRLRVTDTRSRRSVVVVINDRGPFIRGRVLDLSLAAAKELRMTDRGLLKVIAAVE
jgi:rare lipoprotein A